MAAPARRCERSPVPGTHSTVSTAADGSGAGSEVVQRLQNWRRFWVGSTSSRLLGRGSSSSSEPDPPFDDELEPALICSLRAIAFRSASRRCSEVDSSPRRRSCSSSSTSRSRRTTCSSSTAFAVGASRRSRPFLPEEPALGSSETRRTASSRAWRGAGVGVARTAADSPLASLAGGVGAVLDLGHPALQHLPLAHDRLLSVAQRLALCLQLDLHAIGATGDAGDVGLALADGDLAQLHRVVAIVQRALALVQRILAAVEPLFTALDVALGDRDPSLSLAQVCGQALDLGLCLLLGADEGSLGGLVHPLGFARHHVGLGAGDPDSFLGLFDGPLTRVHICQLCVDGGQLALLV